MTKTQKAYRMGLILLLLPVWGKAAGGKEEEDPIRPINQVVRGVEEEKEEEKKEGEKKEEDPILSENNNSQQKCSELEKMLSEEVMRSNRLEIQLNNSKKTIMELKNKIMGMKMKVVPPLSPTWDSSQQNPSLEMPVSTNLIPILNPNWNSPSQPSLEPKTIPNEQLAQNKESEWITIRKIWDLAKDFEPSNEDIGQFKVLEFPIWCNTKALNIRPLVEVNKEGLEG